MPATLMSSNHDPSRGSHAPGDLRDVFLEALDAYLYRGKNVRVVEYRDQKVPLNRVCGLLWNCTDILPGAEAHALRDEVGDERSIETYAQAARAFKGLIASG